jgi:hypothetical protein
MTHHHAEPGGEAGSEVGMSSGHEHDMQRGMHHDEGSETLDTTGMHGMLLVGADPVYLAHLPMFMAPHNYQVILKVSLEDDVSRKLGDFRAHFGRDAFFTVAPEMFAITDLAPSDPAQPARTEFRADLVRGHFEHGGDVISANTLVRVEDVVLFRELPAGPVEEARRGDLKYLLFGDAGRELFLAHSITQPPDFDQVLLVTVSGEHFTETELRRQGGPTLEVPGRTNLPDERLRPDETVTAHSSAGQHFQVDVEVEVLAELYFNEDELR